MIFIFEMERAKAVDIKARTTLFKDIFYDYIPADKLKTCEEYQQLLTARYTPVNGIAFNFLAKHHPELIGYQSYRDWQEIVQALHKLYFLNTHHSAYIPSKYDSFLDFCVKYQIDLTLSMRQLEGKDIHNPAGKGVVYIKNRTDTGQ